MSVSILVIVIVPGGRIGSVPLLRIFGSNLAPLIKVRVTYNNTLEGRGVDNERTRTDGPWVRSGRARVHVEEQAIRWFW